MTSNESWTMARATLLVDIIEDRIAPTELPPNVQYLFATVALVLDPIDVVHLDLEIHSTGFDSYSGRLLAITKDCTVVNATFKPNFNSVGHQVEQLAVTSLRGAVELRIAPSNRDDARLDAGSITVVYNDGRTELSLPLAPVRGDQTARLLAVLQSAVSGGPRVAGGVNSATD
jgi:hypothetical protein